MTYVLLCPGFDPVTLVFILAVLAGAQVAAGAVVGLAVARVIRAVKRSRPVRLR
ncbi:MAG TPA: hypothetical protein VF064_05655 [Pyrinomonadaceae bacterium]